jgi:hypothetical protein
MRTAENGTPIDCRTCLYCATHEKCDGCLSTKEDFAEYRRIMDENRARPITEWVKAPLPSRYLHWEEGNWMDRMIQFEIEGKLNIVIGGQGEAEVNTKWTPEHTAEHLHDVAEQCGYLCGRLRRGADDDRLQISTAEGTFELVWDKSGKLLRAYDVNHSGGWKWDNYNPFREKAA